MRPSTTSNADLQNPYIPKLLRADMQICRFCYGCGQGVLLGRTTCLKLPNADLGEDRCAGVQC
jgi:hypothetical protein